MQKVLYNQGAQSLIWTPVGPQGRVVRLTGSVEYLIEDLRESETSDRRTVGTGTAALDNIDVTLSDAAGAGSSDPRWIPLSLVTGIQAGHRYQLSAGDGYPETVLVVAVEAAAPTGVVVSVPLRGTYSAADTFRGVELTASFPSSVADEVTRLQNGAGPFIVVFTFDLDGFQTRHWEEVWLTRYSITVPITEDEVLLAAPGLAGRISGRRTFDPAIAIMIATKDTMAELEAQRVPTDYFKNGPAMERIVRAKALSYLHRWTDNDGEQADRELAEFHRLVSQLTNDTRPGSVEPDPHTNTHRPGPSTTRNGFLARS